MVSVIPANDLHAEIMFESDEAFIKCLAMLQST